MPNINNLFPSKWIKAADLPAGGITLNIANLVMEDVDESKPPMPVIHFHGHDKGLVLNKTNGQMLAHIFGNPDTDAWVGKPVMLVSEPVQFQGRIVDAVRVKPASAQAAAVPPVQQAPPAPQAAAPTDAPFDDSIPF